jgi:hypothetical protein
MRDILNVMRGLFLSGDDGGVFAVQVGGNTLETP